MDLGAFSISLAVADIHASKEFYEKLGFHEFSGVIEENWLIMKNGEATIGLFQGMFDRNILTFNPGWDSEARPLEDFTDIRQLQQELRQAGLTLEAEADQKPEGPASFSLLDPDGNPILVDQHR